LRIDNLEVDLKTESARRVIVIGAGIVGASVAYHLACKGAQVTVIEAGEVASGVTGRSFAWINTSHSGPDPIAQLRAAAIQEYHRLEAELPDLKIHWTGALSYPPGTDLEASANLLTQAQILDLEPNLKNPPRQAFYNPQEGALDAVQATHALIAGAQALGATVLVHTRVQGFTLRDATVTGVETATGAIEADLVVLAAGTAIRQLTETLNLSLPIEASPAIFIRYRMQPDRVNTLISSPEMEVRQDSQGILLAAEDYLDNSLENHSQAIAQRTAAAIRNELAGIISIEPELACIGLRPTPADGVPIIGYLPGIGAMYVCTMHPGVTLAAVAGRLVSDELIDDQVSPALAPCRPDRFFKT
jgi:glycine/D-amino acid oxidase-like deaminating enzyme